MEDNRAEQIEALEVLAEYSPKLLKGMKAVTEELEGNRQPDTDEYLLAVINGMNWEIQVLNGTLSLINEKSEQIVKEDANRLFVHFSDLYQGKNDRAMAEAFRQEIIPFFEKLDGIARNIEK